jgi:transposase
MTLNPVPAARANARECSCECGCAGRTPFYTSDLTDAQWAALEPLLPVMLCLTVLGGRPEKHHRRAMIDAMLYVADNGVKWRNLPRDFPKWKAVYAMFARWKRDGAWADHGYHGDYRDWAARELGIQVRIAERDPGQDAKGFQVLPRRWVVERTHAWISRRRRCARDYERLPEHHAGMVQLAAITQMTRRLAKTTT